MKKSNAHLAALALAGMTSALAGCGGSTPASESPAQEPAGDKHNCKYDAEGKHICGAAMKKDDKPAEAPATPGAPPEPGKP